MSSELPALGLVVHRHLEHPPTPTGSQADLRHLKSVLVGLAAERVLSWTVVERIFRLIPRFRGL